MLKIKTVFEIKGENYTVEAVGQEAVKAIRNEFKRVPIFLVGFYVNEKFIPANLD